MRADAFACRIATREHRMRVDKWLTVDERDVALHRSDFKHTGFVTKEILFFPEVVIAYFHALNGTNSLKDANGDIIFCAKRSQCLDDILPPLAFYPTHALARNRVDDDDRRLLVYCRRLTASLYELWNVVAVYLQHMPAEAFVFFTQGLKRHDGFGVTVYLNVVAVDDPGEVGKPVRTRKHCRLPEIAAIVLAVGHRTVDAILLPIHSRCVCHAGRLRKSASQRPRCRLEPRQALPLGMSL